MSPSPSLGRPATFVRTFRKAYPVAVRGEGAYVWDAHGKRYLDFSGSAAVNFIGHGVVEIGRAIEQQARCLEFVHTSQFVTAVAEDFAREILDFAGEAFCGGCVYFTSGGSEAVETALKLARQFHLETGHPQRFQIISREQAYHGSTLGAMAVSGNRRRREPYLPMLREFERVSLPYCYRCRYGCDDCARKYGAELADVLERRGQSVAAFIFEPISGATLGAAVPPHGYLQAVSEICQQHGVLTIADEVMTGFGRTGRNFAVAHEGVRPDILVLGKGIASGYAPLGAVVASRRVVDAIASGSGAFVHGFTYNAHPLSMAAGRGVLRRIGALRLVEAADSNQPGTIAFELCEALRALLACRFVGDVRGCGLLWGVEFVADKTTKTPFPSNAGFATRVAEAAAARGLMLYPMQGCVDGESGDHILVAPPAVITRDDIRWAVARFGEAIEEVGESIRG